MSKWYKISLLPLGPYFFGQETRAELGNRQMYFRRSADFPQQSTLLGVMRHQLLLQNGWAIPRVNLEGNPGGLIGKIGFKPGMSSGDYGKIKGLGPVFMQKNGQGHYFLRDREWGLDGKEDVFLKTTMETLNFRSLGASNAKVSLLKHEKGGSTRDYSAKQGFKEYLHDPTAPFETKVELRDVLKPVTTVGVYKFVYRKSEDGDNEQGFFKNVYQVMEKEWTFAFYIEMADDQSLHPGENRVAIMGKERSPFLIRITPSTSPVDFRKEFPAPGTLQKVLLLSDTQVDEAQLLPLCLLINGDTVHYRAFSKPYNGNGRKWYANLNRRRDLSSSYRLLRRGTVIYTEQADRVASLLEEANHWHTIGNNYFTILSA